MCLTSHLARSKPAQPTENGEMNEASPSSPASLFPPAPSALSLMRLAVCAAGICLSYCGYGLLQESLFTGVHLGPTFCLVTACITNVVVALVWAALEGRVTMSARERNSKGGGPNTGPLISVSPEIPHNLLVLTSFFYVVAMTCSNEAIPHVSYPVAVLAKSCKLIPTMLVGRFLEHRTYRRSEWAAALAISLGIVLFHSTRWTRAAGSHHRHHPDQRIGFGMVLLTVSLLSDGLLSTCQNLLKKCGDRRSAGGTATVAPTAVQTMLYVNLYALAFLVPLAVANGQLRTLMLWRVFWWEPVLARHLLWLNLAAGVGQVFVFLTIAWYSPVLCTTITTTRKFVTILLSVYAFGHAFTALQWLAVALVFVGLYTVVGVQQAEQRRHHHHHRQKQDKTE